MSSPLPASMALAATLTLSWPVIGAEHEHDHADHDHPHGHNHDHPHTQASSATQPSKSQDAHVHGPECSHGDEAQRHDHDQPWYAQIEISAITQVAAGFTSGNADTIAYSQTGSHDPSKDGFTLQAFELGVSGKIFDDLRGDAIVVFSDAHGAELEEASITTTGLPHGLEVEAGLMLTEFGLHNPVHSHEYALIDQPLVIGAFLGSEGTRDLGVRVGWSLDTTSAVDWDSTLHLTVQNGDNETAISFLGEGHDHDEEAEGDDHGHDEEGEGESSGPRKSQDWMMCCWPCAGPMFLRCIMIPSCNLVFRRQRARINLKTIRSSMELM